MSAHRAKFRVRTMCRVLGVSVSGFYNWLGREQSAREVLDQTLTKRIAEIHEASRQTYGAPRIHVELQENGQKISRKRVARLMRQSGRRGVSRRKAFRTTRRDPAARPAPDLVQRQFKATRANQLWVADITYIPTKEGFLFLAVVLDVWSRKIVGWGMSSRLTTTVVLEAFAMAVNQRQPSDVIHHSDQGCQYTSLEFGKRCREAGVRPSMGSVGDCYDNAMCESFFATLECELLDRTVFDTRNQAELEVFEFIEGFYNTRRRHSALGYLSPINFEKAKRNSASTDSVPKGSTPPPRSSPSRGRKRGRTELPVAPLPVPNSPHVGSTPRPQPT